MKNYKWFKAIPLFFVPLMCLEGVKNSNSNDGKHLKEKEIQFDYCDYKEQICEHDNCTLTETNGITTYRCRDTLSNYWKYKDVGCKDSDYLIRRDLHIEIESYDDVGLVDLKAEVVNKDNSETEFETTFNGFVVDKDFGKDIIIRTVDDELSLISIASGGLTSPYTDGGKSDDNFGIDVSALVLEELASAGITVVNDSDAADASKTIYSTPIFNPFDLTPYFFYAAVTETAKNHYKVNSELESSIRNEEDELNIEEDDDDTRLFPNNYIVNQSDDRFKQFSFGFMNSNIYSSGCAIISLYNSLVESGEKPSLSALIMTYELSLADFGFGYLGVSPLSFNFLQKENIIKSLILIYELAIKPILNTVAGLIAPLVYLAIPELVTATVIVSTMYTLINSPTNFATRFVNWYLASIKSEGDMLRLFYGIDNVYEFNSWDAFKASVGVHRQAIISFWNSYDVENSSIVTGDGAHFVYFSKVLNDNCDTIYFKTYNACKDGFTNIKMDNLQDVMGGWNVDDLGYAGQFISGFVLKGANN